MSYARTNICLNLALKQSNAVHFLLVHVLIHLVSCLLLVSICCMRLSAATGAPTCIVSFTSVNHNTLPCPPFLGKVSILEDAVMDSSQTKLSEQAAGDVSDTKMKLTTLDIYKELRLRGYDYGKTFQGVLETNNLGNRVMTKI